MINLLMQKMSRPWLIVGLLFSLVASVAFSFYSVHKAYADTTSGCTATGGAQCQEVFAAGTNMPIDDIYYGQGQVYMERTLRAFLYSGTNDNERYMVYVITVTLNPDMNARLANLVTSTPDSSPAGDHATIEVRLWSTNDRITCDTQCSQTNYPQLEQTSTCESSGASQSWTLTQPVEGGGSIGWSINNPLYNWCTYVPSADIWSDYNNYTLQATTQSWTRITQQFVFAQWEPENCCNHQFKIGFFVTTNMFDPGPKVIVPGPASGNVPATFVF